MPDRADVAVDLVAGQLAALAGLGALGHLDLELVGVCEVVEGDPEPGPGSDLFDRGAARVAVGFRGERTRVLPPSPVFDGRRVGSWRSPSSRGFRGRSSRATSRRSRTAARFPSTAFDLVDRTDGNPSPSASRGVARRVFGRTVDLQANSSYFAGGATSPRTACWTSDRLRVPLVELAVTTPRVHTADRRRSSPAFRERLRRDGPSSPGDHVETDAADPRGRAGEVACRSRRFDDRPLRRSGRHRRTGVVEMPIFEIVFRSPCRSP